MTFNAKKFAAEDRAGAKHRSSFDMMPWAYVLPALIVIALILFLPLGLGFWQAFVGHSADDPFSDGGFVGFDNFRALFSDPTFPHIVANTLFWTVANLGFQSVLGLVLALALNGTGRILKLMRPILFLPWAIPSILVGLFWKILFNPGTSFLPAALVAIGVLNQPSDLLAAPDVVIWGPIVAYIWIGVPFFAITSLAALQTIPSELYEASELDGASAWERFWSITLPLIAPMLLIAILLRTTWIANFGDLIWVMTQGGPAGASQIIPTYVYTKAFVDLDDGVAASAALAQLFALMLYSIAIMRLRSYLRKQT